MNIAQEWGNTVKEISEGRRRLGMRRKTKRGAHGASSVKEWAGSDQVGTKHKRKNKKSKEKGGYRVEKTIFI